MLDCKLRDHYHYYLDHLAHAGRDGTAPGIFFNLEMPLVSTTIAVKSSVAVYSNFQWRLDLLIRQGHILELY